MGPILEIFFTVLYCAAPGSFCLQSPRFGLPFARGLIFLVTTFFQFFSWSDSRARHQIVVGRSRPVALPLFLLVSFRFFRCFMYRRCRHSFGFFCAKFTLLVIVVQQSQHLQDSRFSRNVLRINTIVLLCQIFAWSSHAFAFPCTSVAFSEPVAPSSAPTFGFGLTHGPGLFAWSVQFVFSSWQRPASHPILWIFLFRPLLSLSCSTKTGGGLILLSRGTGLISQALFQILILSASIISRIFLFVPRYSLRDLRR